MALADGGARKKLTEAVEALYWKRPTAAELKALGMKEKHFPEPVVTVWPEGWAAIQLFTRVGNQWRAGMGGPFALDYTAVRAEMDESGIPAEDRPELMRHIRVIEAAALEQMRKE